MSVYDNVAFPLREHTRKPEREIKDIVQEKLHMVGLTGAEAKLPGQISGGMRKRAGLARALVLDPEIVLFDEPDSGLDPVRTAFLNELILDLNRQLGATFLVVTHDIATARRVADYIGMLYLRNLIQFGTKDDMFSSEIPAVRQFLAGATRGPIGMSEEADAGRGAVSSFGMTAQELEEREREAGAPGDGEREVRESGAPTLPERRKRADPWERVPEPAAAMAMSGPEAPQTYEQVWGQTLPADWGKAEEVDEGSLAELGLGPDASEPSASTREEPPRRRWWRRGAA